MYRRNSAFRVSEWWRLSHAAKIVALVDRCAVGRSSDATGYAVAPGVLRAVVRGRASTGLLLHQAWRWTSLDWQNSRLQTSRWKPHGCDHRSSIRLILSSEGLLNCAPEHFFFTKFAYFPDFGLLNTFPLLRVLSFLHQISRIIWFCAPTMTVFEFRLWS